MIIIQNDNTLVLILMQSYSVNESKSLRMRREASRLSRTPYGAKRSAGLAMSIKPESPDGDDVVGIHDIVASRLQ